MTPVGYILAALAGLTAAAALTYAILRASLAHGILDVPNQRSSHIRPTPRGAGAALVITIVATEALLGMSGSLDFRTALALAGGGSAMGLLGAWDDLRSASARARLLVQLAIAICAVSALMPVSVISFGNSHYALSGVVFGLTVVAIVWMTNLYNFMDGTDGIAGIQAFVIGTAATLMFSHSTTSGIAVISAVIAGAALGFLIFNWPPARIFLGDVGSGFLGYTIAVLAVAGNTHDSSAGTWILVPMLPFIIDSTLTLILRVLQGHAPADAHRDHLYQLAVRRGVSHGQIALTYGTTSGLLAVLAYFGASGALQFWPVVIWSTVGGCVLYGCLRRLASLPG